MKSLVSLLALSGILAAQTAEPRDAKTVCDVLRERLKFDGKMLAIRGILVWSDEGAWLTGEKCDNVLVTGEYTWPVGIWLASPTDSTILHKVDFQADRTTLQKYAAIVGRNKGQRIWVTFTGMFETREDLARFLRRDQGGKLTGRAFGHLGSAPGQLVVKTVSLTDIVVEPLP